MHGKECAGLLLFKEEQKRDPPAQVILMCRCLRRKIFFDRNSDEESSYEALLKCVSNWEFQTDESKETFAQTSLMVKSLLGPSDWQKLINVTCHEGDLFRQIVHNFSRFFCNNWTIYDGELIALGGGVFPKIALLNHNCNPTCCVMFQFDNGGPRGEVRAIQDIKIGDELNLSYVDTSYPTLKRKEMLKSGYFFDCTCCRCSSVIADDSVESERDRMLTANKCQHPDCGNVEISDLSHFLSTRAVEKLLRIRKLSSISILRQLVPTNGICSGYLVELECLDDRYGSIKSLRDCRSKSDDLYDTEIEVDGKLQEPVSQVLICIQCLRVDTFSSIRADMLEKAKSIYTAALEARENYAGNAFSLFEECIEIGKKVFAGFNMDLFSWINAFSMHLIDLGHFEEAEKWVAESLIWYEYVYPQTSPILGLHYLIYARLLWRLEKAQACIPFFEKGINILRNSHGLQHTLIQEAKKSLVDAENECKYHYHKSLHHA